MYQKIYIYIFVHTQKKVMIALCLYIYSTFKAFVISLRYSLIYTFL